MQLSHVIAHVLEIARGSAWNAYFLAWKDYFLAWLWRGSSVFSPWKTKNNVFKQNNQN
jgi:hypothetical protein